MKNGYYLSQVGNLTKTFAGPFDTAARAYDERKDFEDRNKVAVTSVYGTWPSQLVIAVNREGSSAGQNFPLASVSDQIAERVLSMLEGQNFADWYGDGGDFDKFISGDDGAPTKKDILKTLSAFFEGSGVSRSFNQRA